MYKCLYSYAMCLALAGYIAYLSAVRLDAAYNNPVLNVFIYLLSKERTSYNTTSIYMHSYTYCAYSYAPKLLYYYKGGQVTKPIILVKICHKSFKDLKKYFDKVTAWHQNFWSHLYLFAMVLLIGLAHFMLKVFLFSIAIHSYIRTYVVW